MLGRLVGIAPRLSLRTQRPVDVQGCTNATNAGCVRVANQPAQSSLLNERVGALGCCLGARYPQMPLVVSRVRD